MDGPTFSNLSDDASRALLARKHIGRLAYSLHDRVDIQPVNYVYADGWIFARTQVGSKIMMLAHHPWCAFEVDEVHGLFSWESVVAHGSVNLLDPESGSLEVYERALDAIRTLIPETFTTKDPTPRRGILFGIWVQELTGRSARPAAQLIADDATLPSSRDRQVRR
jgi:nitroimidazol reductase NimA-like FMN-containing flavoprotein (pyridoxamine 5'-phosphate oxidase superfamily)